MQLSENKITKFRKKIWKFYKENGREFSWRRNVTPYTVLVSEIMLQQTQVARVEKKFVEFMEAFPSVEMLARANQSEVLTVWQGMGYNRRAKYLLECARAIVKNYNGVVPREIEVLNSLPGIGKNTAGSIRAFAYNLPSVFIETNIRTVYMDEFFKREIASDEKISDAVILPLIEKTLDANSPGEWYYALMDYGTHLKKTIRLNDRSSTYKKQSTFKGSSRQVRASIVRTLLKNSPMTIDALIKKVTFDVKNPSKYLEKKLFLKIINSLLEEKIIERRKNHIFISQI